MAGPRGKDRGTGDEEERAPIHGRGLNIGHGAASGRPSVKNLSTAWRAAPDSLKDRGAGMSPGVLAGGIQVSEGEDRRDGVEQLDLHHTVFGRWTSSGGGARQDSLRAGAPWSLLIHS